jgi:inositol transport system substrate-binding protein
MRKVLIAMFLVALIGGTAFAGGRGEDEGQFVIGYTFHAASDVFQNTLKNFFVEAAEAEGIKVTVIDPQLDIERQVGAIETFITQQVDAIVCSPLDFHGLAPAVKMAQEAGIPFVALNSTVDASGPGFSYVGSKNYDAGLIQAEYFKEILPEGSKLVYLEGTPGMEHAVDRKAAVMENLVDVRPDIELLASQTAEYDRTKGMNVMEDWIQAFPDIEAVIAANDQMALGSIEALKGAGRLEGVFVTGIDGTPGARQSIRAGEMTMSVVQDGEGQAEKGLEVAMMMINGEDVDEEYIVPFFPIDAETVDTYYPND